jgi:multidrug efflux pump subunit AcrA (membrane-fusion protein)
LRQNPTVVNNVTTYSAIASVDNASGLLRPGMNATVRIIVVTYVDALVVPVAALQWRPNGNNVKNYRIDSPPQEERATSARSVWGQTGNADTAVSPGAVSRVYVPNGRVLEGVVVRVLAIDGSRAAIAVVKGALHRDDAVITGPAS